MMDFLNGPFQVEAAIQTAVSLDGSVLPEASLTKQVGILNEGPVEIAVKSMELLYAAREHLTDRLQAALAQAAHIVMSNQWFGKGDRAAGILAVALYDLGEGPEPATFPEPEAEAEPEPIDA